MKKARITTSGQLSIPAAIRKRWGTSLVVLDDLGDRLVVKPLPDDPIAAARGVFEGRIGSTDELRKKFRHDDAAATNRRR